MADRSRKTRRKTTLRVPATRPRNPLIAPAIKRVAGPHRKPAGALRSAAKVALKRNVERDDDDG